MGRGRFYPILQLDIRQLPAADNVLLGLRGKGIPCLHIVQVFLHQDIAAAGKGSVLFAHQRRLEGQSASRILRPIDETDQVAILKVAEALHLVGNRNRVADACHDLGCQLKADVHSLGTDVKQHVARSGRGMAIACPELPERMQFGGPGIAEEPVPGIGSEGRDTSERGVDVAELDRANQAGEVAAKRAQGGVLSASGFTVTTRKIAARVSCASTGCATTGKLPATSGALIGSTFIGRNPGQYAGCCYSEYHARLRARVGA